MDESAKIGSLPEMGCGMPGTAIGCELPIKERCFELRMRVEDLKRGTKRLLQHGIFRIPPATNEQHSEMKANIMLAYRHLEDARMRLGKVVQAYDGGKSVYPK